MTSKSVDTNRQHLLKHQLTRIERLKQIARGFLRKSVIERSAIKYIKNVQDQRLRDFQQVRQLKATIESIEFADVHMGGAKVVRDKRAVLDTAISYAEVQGLYLEFGVWSGRTINFIAERHKGIVHGFDSFEGLPENWYGTYDKGSFATEGWMPKVRSNVSLHKGWFENTLPVFVDEQTELVAFLHIDCDLYSSTQTIFQHLGDRIVKGTVIVFDEYFNYPGWQDHEHKAFQEFLVTRNLSARFLCYNETECNAAAMIV